MYIYTIFFVLNCTRTDLDLKWISSLECHQTSTITLVIEGERSKKSSNTTSTITSALSPLTKYSDLLYYKSVFNSCLTVASSIYTISTTLRWWWHYYRVQVHKGRRRRPIQAFLALQGHGRQVFLLDLILHTRLLWFSKAKALLMYVHICAPCSKKWKK